MESNTLYQKEYIFLITFLIILITGCSKSDNENTAPIAKFSITPSSGTISTVFEFNASACSDKEDLEETLQVRWDWEGDGVFDTDFSSNKVLYNQYDGVGNYQVILEVKDSKNLTTSTSILLEINYGPLPIVVTLPITNITGTSFSCGGNVLDMGGTDVTSRGICWNTESNPTISDLHTNNGSGTGQYSSEITGLTPHITYYVRAYATNLAGTSYGQEDSVVVEGWQCGESIIIEHIAGSVAPVNKTVEYKTLANVNGEELLCWITQNLGADHQATALSDNSELSAGWYWQFNLLQGYKHDGFYRVPETIWDGSLIQNSDWLPDNDPCTSELGSGWRIPTKSEWDNIDAAGDWEDWTGPWNSPLKLHAGGFLNYPDAELRNRGTSGSHWSSKQVNNTNSWHIDFRSTNSGTYSNSKSYGLSLRCVYE